MKIPEPIERLERSQEWLARDDEHTEQDLEALQEILVGHLGNLFTAERRALAAELDDWAQRRYGVGPESHGDVVQMRRRQNPSDPRARETLRKMRVMATKLYNDPNVGRDRITLRMVAQESGLSDTTIYRFWSDRIAMLDDIAPFRPRR